MSIIILDGPDGGGKSTLAQELVKEGWTYLHHGLYDDKPEDLLKRYARDILEPPSPRMVIDRSYLSEGPYGFVMRGKDRLGALGVALMSRLCRARGVVEVICLPPFEVCYENWRNRRSEEYVSGPGAHAKFATIYKTYEWLLKHLPHLWRYDYTWEKGTPKELVHASGVSKVMREGNPWLPEGVLGSPEARYLIVGEQVNVKKYWVDLPFFALNGVSAWFYEVLWECRAVENELAFVNAFDAKGFIANLRDITWKLPNFHHAVALGEQAAWACHQQGVKYVKVPHPNYWSRFHRKDTRSYVLKVREALYGE